MTLTELIGRLESILVEAEDYGYGDPEVRIAYQPGWPMQENVCEITDSIEAGMLEAGPDEVVVWIGGDGSNSYAPGAVSQALWNR